MIGRGAAERRIVETVAERYGAEADEVAASVRRFVEQLELEGLVVRGDDDSAAASDDAPLEPLGANGSRTPFAPPLLSKFTDLEHLIRLDPIMTWTLARGGRDQLEPTALGPA